MAKTQKSKSVSTKKATVSKSAHEARELMFLRPDDGVTMSGIPTACQADEEGQENARALTCNEGAEGADEITFQLVADGEAEIDFL